MSVCVLLKHYSFSYFHALSYTHLLLISPVHSAPPHPPSFLSYSQPTKRSNAIQLHNVFISFIFSSRFYLISWPFSSPFVCGKNGNYAVYVFYWLHSFDCFMFGWMGLSAEVWNMRATRVSVQPMVDGIWLYAWVRACVRWNWGKGGIMFSSIFLYAHT